MRNKWIKRFFPLFALLLLAPWTVACAHTHTDDIAGQDAVQIEVTEVLVPPSQSVYESAEGTEPSSQEQAHYVSDASNQLPDSEPVSITPSIVPNDSYFDKQWALAKIQALEAWQVTSGSQDVLIAILDTGIDPNHEDLEGDCRKSPHSLQEMTFKGTVCVICGYIRDKIWITNLSVGGAHAQAKIPSRVILR